MNNTCVGSCVHEVGCKTAGQASSRLDASGTRFLDKLRQIPSEPNGSRMGFYLGGAQTSAYPDFHNARVMKKMRPRIEYWKHSAHVTRRETRSDSKGDLEQ